MKKSLFASVGFLLIMSMVGCCYNAGSYDPCTGCTVGDGWQAGCSHGCPPGPAPCQSSCEPTCGGGQCNTGCGSHYHGGYHGSCYGGHAGCHGGYHSCWNPLVWIRNIFDFTFCCNRYDIASTTDFFCGPGCGQGGGCHHGGCHSGGCQHGGYNQGGYNGYGQEMYPSAPQQISPVQPVPLPVPPAQAAPVTYRSQVIRNRPASFRSTAQEMIPSPVTDTFSNRSR